MAIGVSHLVQATRAGAMYGVALLFIIVLTMLAKYPAFRFGPQYTAATGESLLDGYLHIGAFVVIIFVTSITINILVGTTGVVLITAGLTISVLNLSLDSITVSAILLVTCSLILAAGSYQLLDKVTKVLLAILTISTLIATLLVLPRITWNFTPQELNYSQLTTIFFIVALIGWMPTPVETSVWQSLWTAAKARQTGYLPTVDNANLDFHIGYAGTMVIAICFLLMGAGVMYGGNQEVASDAASFATQVISLYKDTIGDWVGPIVGVAAFSVMFSTLLLMLDVFPRTITALHGSWRSRNAKKMSEAMNEKPTLVYFGTLSAVITGSLMIMIFFMENFRSMIDFAASIAFVTAPFFALFNHLAITSERVPPEYQPEAWLRIWSLAGIAGLMLFAIIFLSLKLSAG